MPYFPIWFSCLGVYLLFVGILSYDARNTVMTPKMARRIVLWPLIVCHYIIKKLWLAAMEITSVIVMCFKKETGDV